MNYKIFKGFPNYHFYDNGIIYSTIKKRNLSNGKRNEIKLTYKGEIKNARLIRLFYELHYEEKPTDKDQIIFKDDTIENKYCKENLLKIEAISYRKYKGIVTLDPNKEWKVIKNYERYTISNYGDVYSSSFNIMLKPNLTLTGYHTVELYNNQGHDRFLVHRLVFDAFKGLSGNPLLMVDHFDQVKTNNFIENLREVPVLVNLQNRTVTPTKHQVDQYTKEGVLIKSWESMEELKIAGYHMATIVNCCLGHKKLAYKCIWKYANKIEDASEFVNIISGDEYTYSRYKINNKGQIISVKYNRLLKQNDKQIYKTITLVSDKGKKVNYRVHRLVATTFLQNDKELTVVNHKDLDKSNPDVSNLEWCTQQQNIVHGHGTKVNKIDIKTGKVLKTYDSISMAYIDLNKKYTNSIYRTCVGKHNSAYGFKWEYANRQK